MVLRVVVGVGWSVITGLAGGWLVVSPWALGEQPGSGDWTNVTQTQFWTGAGLVALAVLGLALTGAQIAAALRAGPAAQSAGYRGRTGSAGAAADGEMDAALVSLANALAADLNRQQAAAPAQYPTAPTAPQMVPPNGPPYQYAPQAPQNPQPPQAPQAPQAPQPPQPGEPWRGGR